MIEIMNAKRIVVKIGSSSLMYENGGPNLKNIERLVRALSGVKNSGREVVLISSGAIGVGVAKLRLQERPADTKGKQAAASVGQCELMHIYDKFFAEYGHVVGQVLLTRNVVDNEISKNNVVNTFNTLLELGVVPIVNENDAVSTVELDELANFGDNDNLAATVATLIGADLVVLFSDIDGLYSKNPKTHSDAKLIPVVYQIDKKIEALCSDSVSGVGTGGMITKIAAAKTVTEQGIDMILLNGAHPEKIYDMFEGKIAGTLFLGREKV